MPNGVQVFIIFSLHKYLFMSKSQDQEKKLLSLQTEDRREVENTTVQI